MGERPRVLQLCPDFPPALGGISDYARRLCEQLAQLDFDVRVLTSTRSKDRSAGAYAIAATVEHWDARLTPAVADEIAAFKPDVLHIQYQQHMYAGHHAVGWLPWRLRRRPPIVTTLHDMTPPSMPPRIGGRLAFEALLYGSDRLLVSGEAEARGLARRPGLRSRSAIGWIGSNIELHPLPAERKRAVRATVARDPDSLLAITLGLIRPGKGIEVLLESAADLRSRGVPLELLIVGDVGDADLTARRAYYESVLERSRALGLEDTVHFLGHLPEERVSELLQAADLGVLPFEHGASAGHTTVLAALSHGLPLLTTRGLGTPAMLTRGAVALVDAPPDAQQLASAIERLYRDPQLRETTGVRGRELSDRSPSIGTQAAEIYRELIRRRSR